MHEVPQASVSALVETWSKSTLVECIVFEVALTANSYACLPFQQRRGFKHQLVATKPVSGASLNADLVSEHGAVEMSSPDVNELQNQPWIHTARLQESRTTSCVGVEVVVDAISSTGIVEDLFVSCTASLLQCSGRLSSQLFWSGHFTLYGSLGSQFARPMLGASRQSRGPSLVLHRLPLHTTRCQSGHLCGRVCLNVVLPETVPKQHSLLMLRDAADSCF